MQKTDAIVLFSGGLDSILAARLLMEQGLNVLCLHMVTPFFGSSKKSRLWKKLYGVDVVTQDISEAFVNMLRTRPPHGFGKHLNPCVDCKILLLRQAKRFMLEQGAKIIASGAVVGQRPMSQRRDVLNTIIHEAEVEDFLLRPLSALQLEESSVEKKGLVDRSRLLGISGRGRKDQLSLARERYHLQQIPSPSGGCPLTEQENARRYWLVLTRVPEPSVSDFRLASVGRQLWRCEGEDSYWICVGRNQEDNRRLLELQSDQDLVLRFPNLPSPITLARGGQSWPHEIVLSAGRLTLSYACKALKSVDSATMLISGQDVQRETMLTADRMEPWRLPSWETVHAEIKAERAKKLNVSEGDCPATTSALAHKGSQYPPRPQY